MHILDYTEKKTTFPVMHLCESWMKKHWEAQFTLGFSCKFSQSGTFIFLKEILSIYSCLFTDFLFITLLAVF